MLVVFSIIFPWGICIFYWVHRHGCLISDWLLSNLFCVLSIKLLSITKNLDWERCKHQARRRLLKIHPVLGRRHMRKHERAQRAIFVCLALIAPQSIHYVHGMTWSLGCLASFLDHSSAYEQSGYGGGVEGSMASQQYGCLPTTWISFHYGQSLLNTQTSSSRNQCCALKADIAQEIRQPTAYAVKLDNFCQSLG